MTKDKIKKALKICADGVSLYCMIFDSLLKEENYHCKRLKICRESEVQNAKDKS